MRRLYLLLALLLPMTAQAQNLSQLTAKTTPILDTDTTFWCDVVTGCDPNPAHPIVRVTASTIGNYVIGKITATPPLYISSNTLSLSIDSTLSVVGGQLHAVGGGSGGVSSLTAGTGITLTPNPIVATGTVACATFGSSLVGCVPASGGGTTNFLRADGTWAAPPGGGGAVSSVTGSGQVTASPTTGAVVIGSTGVSTSYTVASSCTGASCTPATQCWAISGGIISSITSGACSGIVGGALTGGGGNFTGGGGSLTGG